MSSEQFVYSCTFLVSDIQRVNLLKTVTTNTEVFLHGL